MSEADEQRQYLSFLVHGGEYALEILQVREIIPFSEVTPLPRVPEFVLGLINLRGTVVPIIDLALRLGFERTARTKRTSVVVCELELDGEWTRLGLLTDDVSQVLELGPDDLEPAPKLGAPVSASFLRGIGKVESRFVLILDVDTVIGGEAMRAAWELLSGEDSSAPPEAASMPPDS